MQRKQKATPDVEGRSDPTEPPRPKTEAEEIMYDGDRTDDEWESDRDKIGCPEDEVVPGRNGSRLRSGNQREIRGKRQPRGRNRHRNEKCDFSEIPNS